MPRSTLLFCTAFLLSVVSAGAYNHPEIHWKSVTTSHFIINYYDKTEPAVYATWKIAEATYESLSKLYDFTSNQKIVLSLASYDDESNGWSSWLVGAVLILLPDARFDMRGNTTWLRQVITHELTHHFSLTKRHRRQVLDWTLALSYASPSASVSVEQPIPAMTLYPSWLAEGVAQAGSDYLRSDCWDSRRDMVLRCAVLSNATLSLDAMGVFNHDSRADEMVYNQGYSLVRYIEQRFGRKTLAGIMEDGATDRLNFEAYFKLKTGSTLSQVYDSWLDSLRSAYGRSVPAATTPLTARWSGGFYNFKPRWSVDGKRWGCLTNQNDDFDRTDLIIFDAHSNRQIARIAYAQTSWDFSPDGNLVYYVKAHDPDAQGSYLNDLFQFDLVKGSERRLTRDGRVYDVAVSPTGRQLAVTRFDEGAFSLDLFSPADARFVKLLAGELGAPFTAPCFNPADSNSLVVARVTAGHSQLYLVDIAGRSMTPLAAAPCQQESPCWSRNGRIYFSADFDGIFNIYSEWPDSLPDIKRHSTVVGGLFSPALGPSNELLCSEYAGSGFGIVSFSDTGSHYSCDSTGMRCLFDSLPRPRGKVRIDSRDYKAKMLRPYSELLTFAQFAQGDSALNGLGNSGGAGFGITIHRTDALEKKSLDLSLVAELIGYTVDSSSAAAANGFAALSKSLRSLALRQAQQRPALFQKAGDRPFERCPALTDFVGGRAAVVSSSRAPVASDSGSQTFQPAIVAVPSLMYENSTLAPTFGIDLMAEAPMGIPEQVEATPYMIWQVWRDIDIGVSPQFAAGYPMGVAGSVPIWLEWTPSGYYNTDINYNLAGVSDLSIMVMPIDFFPLQTISSTYATGGSPEYDTTTSTGTGFGAGVSFMHLFPILRYASIGPNVDALYQSFNESVSISGTNLLGYSTRYLAMAAGADLHLPLARQINAGRSPYFDALYATISYRLQTTMNGDFLDSGNMNDFWQVAGGDLRLDSTIAVSQTVSASVQLGLYRAYTFSLVPTVTVSYELLRRRLFFDALLSF